MKILRVIKHLYKVWRLGYSPIKFIINWHNDGLDRPYIQKASDAKTFKHFLLRGFDWNKSPEGWAYWADCCRSKLHILRKK